MRAALRVRRLRLVALVLGASVAVSGCRTGSPLHNRYNDFRAYYNAYYNASRVMDEGERQLERPDQVVDRTRLVPIFPEGSGARGTQFQEAIDKSSDLLRERATSKWADDALFLIGKAYFYQGNVVGAELKFRETIQLAESRGNGRLADESRMWLGRTLGLAERYDEGAALLQERLALAEGNRRDQARLRLVLGELFARAGRYDEAAASLREGVPDEPDDDTAARGLLLLGQVEELRGEFIAAAEAYREATDRRPAYEIGYAADISRALVLGLDAGRVEDALDLIRRMRRDDKNYQHRAEVELAYGRILSVAGQGREGREAMRSVLYDPLLQGGSLRGEAHVRLAEFYRDIRNDFVQASAHLDTAATSIRQSGASTDQNLARAALTDVPRTASAFNAYATVAVRLAEADSLLELGMLDDEAFAARIREIEAQRLEVYRQEQRRLEQTRTQQEFAGGAQSAFREGSATQRSPNNRAPGVAPASVGGTEVGFLSYRDQASVQANLLAFQRTWGERPLVPNWRRQAAIDASTVTAEDGQGIDPERLGRGAASSGPPPLDLSPIPRTPEAQIALRAERASLRYEAANALFLSLARPDSAATLYTLALEDGGPPEVSRQIRFALAEVETSRGRTEAAEALYRQIIEDAPETELADAARLRLGLDVATPDAEAAEPTSLAYEQARLRWTEGAYATAVGDFLALAADTSRADEAPRALLAAATAYIEWAHRDSFDVRRPLPESVIPPGLFPEPEAPGPEAVTPETPAPPV
ncbi:MAG: tetratricopeptide repeat protein, partial [Bacteroidota bacterium]